MVLDGVAAFKLLSEFNLRGFVCVLKAHFSFYISLPSMQRKRRQAGQFGRIQHSYEKVSLSIVFQFYIRKRKRFNEFYR